MSVMFYTLYLRYIESYWTDKSARLLSMKKVQSKISFQTKDTEKVSGGHLQKTSSIFPPNMDFHPLTFKIQPQFFLPHTNES